MKQNLTDARTDDGQRPIITAHLELYYLFPVVTGYYANIHTKHEIIDWFPYFSNIIKLLLGGIYINHRMMIAKKRKCVFDLGELV